MMDPYLASSMQQDLFNVVEAYTDAPAPFPPENFAVEDAHRKLSKENIENASQMVMAYLGMGTAPASIFGGLAELMMYYFFDTRLRAMVVGFSEQPVLRD